MYIEKSERINHLRIQPWLGWPAGTEEESIDGFQISIGIDYNQTQNTEGYNPCIYRKKKH
jgi:hypothetical protein